VIRYLLRAPSAVPVPFPRVGDPDATELNVVPREYVVDAIDHLSRDDRAVGETYQLCDPAPPTIRQWVRLLSAATDRRVLPIPATRRLAREALSPAPIRRLTGVQPALLDYLSHPTTYSPAAARGALPADLVPPPVGSYVENLVAYVRANPEADVGAMV
jgi:hypothetical protein